MENAYERTEEIENNGYKNGNIDVFDLPLNFGKLRLSALTKAAEISPFIKEVTIGPNSPERKQELNNIAPDNTQEKQNNAEENLIEDKLRDELRHTLIMKEYERKLKEASEELFSNLIKNMIAKRYETIAICHKKQKEENERRRIELETLKLQILKGNQDNDNLAVLEKARLDEQKVQINNKQTIENINRILEEQAKATARFAAITDSHTKIYTCYNEIILILQTEPHGKAICDKYMTSIKTVLENIDMVRDLCKTGVITDKEVKQAEILSLNIENIKIKIIENVNKLKQQELLKKQEEEALKKKEFEEQKAQEARATENTQIRKHLPEQSKMDGLLFYSTKNYNHYQVLKNFLDEYESKYKNLLEDVNLKKFRFDCQKAVNTPVNAISSVSGMHMRDKFDKLSKLLRGDRVQVLDIHVTATQHPQGIYYCTALLAKKIVRQGELLVSSKPEAAFPLAAITVALCTQFPEFGKLLEAYFHRYCPYLVPMFLPKTEGQTDKEFYISRGYTYNDEGIVEKQDKFLRRMSGIFRLCCAIWITKTPRFLSTPNPHGLRYAWKWLTSFINLKPEPDICATLLLEFFTVCGSEFIKNYGRQFTKVIKLTSTDYFAILQNIDEGGPKTRLEDFLQNVLRTGHIPPPNGVLPLNTW